MDENVSRSAQELQVAVRLNEESDRHGVLLPGQVRVRPPVNQSQAYRGVQPLTPFAQGSQKFQPLPEPQGNPPYHFKLSDAVPGIDAAVEASGSLVFHVAGDTGGVKNADYQSHVAAAMKGDLLKPETRRPRFFYHLGDIVYYNGLIRDYYAQFYEPYDHYGPPILSIPGNHDGDPIDGTQTSLDGWVRYFMTSKPHINPESHDAPRATLTLPNVYYSLECPLVTIVGMYSNVPEGGSIDSVQQQWLTNELATAPEDKALIVAVHHPIYSFDNHHSGSPRMADALQYAINDSRRVPNMVLAAHVHNYQRIERKLVHHSPTPFLVAGNGGYYHLHGMNIDPSADRPTSYGRHDPPVEDPHTGAALMYSNHTNHGYCTLTITRESIHGVASLVAESHHPAMPNADTFDYNAAALKLSPGETISL